LKLKFEIFSPAGLTWKEDDDEGKKENGGDRRGVEAE
jgi:hypothetical protein